MKRLPRFRLLVLGLVAAAALAAAATAAVTLVQISSDPYSSPTVGQHHTEVEPDTFAAGSTIVAATQMGRIFGGGSTDTGFATSTDGGNTWTHGPLPGVTKAEGGQYDAGSDPSVAYDAKHDTWLAATLVLRGGTGVGVVTNRSTDGGLTWQNPVFVAGAGFADKSWVVCDDSSSSTYYGHCYVEFDDASSGDRIEMVTSTDGGQTWGAPVITSNFGLGGQPLVTKKGLVVVPYWGNEIDFFTSSNGGASWSGTKVISSQTDHGVAGNLRTEPLPSAEIDASGRVYVVWQDCRFRTNCSSNDIVMATIKKGKKVSPTVRIPIDPTNSGVDHFIPGLAVDPSTGNGKHNPAHLGLAYYYYPNANCTQSTCQLDVGFVSSTDGGATWSAPTQLAGPMTLTWLANTSQGWMVGDYISSSFVDGAVRSVFAVAHAPNGSVLDEAMNTATSLAKGGSNRATTGPILSKSSDHPALGPSRTAQ